VTEITVRRPAPVFAFAGLLIWQDFNKGIARATPIQGRDRAVGTVAGMVYERK
jgi:hypothetical protein